jgi:hypothetical protein
VKPCDFKKCRELFFRYAFAANVGSVAVFQDFEIETKILPFETASEFSHSLGHKQTTKHLGDYDRFPLKQPLRTLI